VRTIEGKNHFSVIAQRLRIRTCSTLVTKFADPSPSRGEGRKLGSPVAQCGRGVGGERKVSHDNETTLSPALGEWSEVRAKL
jgi:hypothetical protein